MLVDWLHYQKLITSSQQQATYAAVMTTLHHSLIRPKGNDVNSKHNPAAVIHI